MLAIELLEFTTVEPKSVGIGIRSLAVRFHLESLRL
jgi:hypothetical protein